MNFIFHHLAINGSVAFLYYIVFCVLTLFCGNRYYRQQIRRGMKTILLGYLSWYTWQFESLAISEGVVMHLRVTALVLSVLAISPVMRILNERIKYQELQDQLSRNNHY